MSQPVDPSFRIGSRKRIPIRLHPHVLQGPLGTPSELAPNPPIAPSPPLQSVTVLQTAAPSSTRFAQVCMQNAGNAADQAMIDMQQACTNAIPAFETSVDGHLARMSDLQLQPFGTAFAMQSVRPRTPVPASGAPFVPEMPAALQQISKHGGDVDRDEAGLGASGTPSKFFDPDEDLLVASTAVATAKRVRNTRQLPPVANAVEAHAAMAASPDTVLGGSVSLRPRPVACMSDPAASADDARTPHRIAPSKRS